MTLIEYYFSKIYENDSWLMIEKIRTLCYDLLMEYQSKDNNSGGESLNRATSTLGGKDALSDFDLFVSERKKGKTSHMKSELDHYLEEDVLPRNQNFDILAWWKSNGLKYPTLQTIARDVLSVPVSTVASESAFSISGRVVSPNRSKLHPKTLEALMCAQSWLFAIESEDEPEMSANRFATMNDDMDVDDGVSTVTNVDVCVL
ncbi:Zinc finger BED domain-containing protein [Actinidia chinensis var. chinensis]|uniref:Zinc finger BED domain-containing protein n=1 Tax=Actinidia chinensis var. chinensis TaxID=1590841 RepID=A0A2R6Q262_ACTCC|nr:Zinc finger BED domain-containing protein [Actinidia chinensis var. chinensis]